jgi:N-acetyl-gamma-glutamyl-phosphate reductase
VALELEPFDADAVAERSDAALVAYPHGAAAPVVQELRGRGLRVVDLSADFRLDRESYERYYQPHAAPGLIDEAVYGLTELHRDAIRAADLVAAPGCYPTAAILALAPLRGLIADAVVDAKSGVSGAGRDANETTHFVSVDENVNAYKVEGHRHRAELEQEIGGAITFTPHLLPIPRGILSTVYVRLRQPMSEADVLAAFRKFYASSKFVRVFAPPKLPQVQFSTHTNFCDIGFVLGPDRQKLIVISCLDNLLKGAAGQAVQNMNLMFGYAEEEALV